MKPIIDFQILPTTDPRVILVADNSKWEHIENKPAIIEITVAGSEDPVVHYFQKGKINSFNTINLMLNCGQPCGCDGNEYNFIPDGVYKITVKGSPDTFFCTKEYLHTANTRLELDRLYIDAIKCGGTMDETKKRSLDEIEFLLMAAEANVRVENICDAQELLFAAQGRITSCGGCKDCF